jgi:hypothetical protein
MDSDYKEYTIKTISCHHLDFDGDGADILSENLLLLDTGGVAILLLID